MQDPYVIMTTGFKNSVTGAAAATGYQIKIRIPYYRGVYLSAVDYLKLTVDGQEIARDNLRIVVNGRTFTMPEMEEAGDTRWFYGDPATLLVAKPGGLVPGIHTITVGITIRKSYFPAEDPERLYDFFGLWKSGQYKPFIEPPTLITKKVTLVQ